MSEIGFPLRNWDSVADTSGEDLVDRLIPKGALVLLTGDSTIGKTPFAYQLSYCVSGGFPFLGHSVRRGRVFYIDQENGREQVGALRRGFQQYFGISEDPHDFRIYNPYLIGRTSQILSALSLNELLDSISHHPADVVVIDTLMSNDVNILADPVACGIFLGKIRNIARIHGVTFILLTHPKKLQNGPLGLGKRPDPFDPDMTRAWFDSIYGTSALMNGVDVRLGLEEIKGDDVVAEKGLFGISRVIGHIPPIYLTTRRDDVSGDPLGYEVVPANLAELPPGMATVLGVLPESFTYAEFTTAFNKPQRAVDRALRKGIQSGVIFKLPARTGRFGGYRKIP